MTDGTRRHMLLGCARAVPRGMVVLPSGTHARRSAVEPDSTGLGVMLSSFRGVRVRAGEVTVPSTGAVRRCTGGHSAVGELSEMHTLRLCPLRETWAPASRDGCGNPSPRFARGARVGW